MNEEMLKAGSIQTGSESGKETLSPGSRRRSSGFTREDRSESDRARDWDATSDSNYISVGEKRVPLGVRWIRLGSISAR